MIELQFKVSERDKSCTLKLHVINYILIIINKIC
jgi:hypothetical protein